MLFIIIVSISASRISASQPTIIGDFPDITSLILFFSKSPMSLAMQQANPNWPSLYGIFPLLSFLNSPLLMFSRSCPPPALPSVFCGSRSCVLHLIMSQVCPYIFVLSSLDVSPAIQSCSLWNPSGPLLQRKSGESFNPGYLRWVWQEMASSPLPTWCCPIINPSKNYYPDSHQASLLVWPDKVRPSPHTLYSPNMPMKYRPTFLS